MKTVGVVLPVYNEADYLPQTLRSLAQQKIAKENYFLVIVDNGSTDRTPQVIKTFQRDHPDLKLFVFKELKRGVRFARKTGFDKAVFLGADYLLSIDGDTNYPSDMVDSVLNALVEQKNAIFRGKVFFSAKTRLLQVLYLEKFLKLKNFLQKKEEEIFGPTVSAGYFALSSELYSKLWWQDINESLIFLEGPVIVRRLYFLGCEVLKESSNFATTSDRRFWADLSGWALNKRKKNWRIKEYRKNKDLLNSFDYSSMYEQKIAATCDRWLKQFVDLLMMRSLGLTQEKRFRTISHKFLKEFGLPNKAIKKVPPGKSFACYSEFRLKYFSLLEKRLFQLTKRYVKAAE